MHGVCQVRTAGHFDDVDVGVLRHKMRGSDINRDNGVYVAGLNRCLPRIDVGDGQQLDGIEMGAPFLPVVGEAFGQRSVTG